MYAVAYNGHADALQLLLQAKADPDKASDNDGTTPMFMAAQEGHADALQLLLDAKADCSLCMHCNGWSPLFVASGAGNAEVVRRLLERAPSLRTLATTAAHDFWGCTIASGAVPVDVARQLHREDVLQLLQDAATP